MQSIFKFIFHSQSQEFYPMWMADKIKKGITSIAPILSENAVTFSEKPFINIYVRNTLVLENSK